MPSERPAKPFYFDELTRKHESYAYDESDSFDLKIDHEGRPLHLLMPYKPLPVSFRIISIEGDYFFAIGDVLDSEDADRTIVEGGDGVLVVGVKLADRDDTYWTLAWHNLFGYTLHTLDQYHRKQRMKDV
jgi:hypothetical protein